MPSYNRLFRLFFIALFLLAWLVACLPATPSPRGLPAPQPTWTPYPTIQPRPDFIQEVSPPESVAIPLQIYAYDNPGEDQLGYARDVQEAYRYGYDSDICVLFFVADLLEEGDNLTSEELLLERITLLINGSNTPATLSDRALISRALFIMVGETGNPTSTGVGPEPFCWKAELGVGVHQIVFQFRQTSGIVQQYAWHLVITEAFPPLSTPNVTPTPAGTAVPLPTVLPLPTPMPTPDFVVEAIPDPSTIVAVNEWDHRICFGTDTILLFGDDSFDEEILERRFSVTVNGKPIKDMIGEPSTSPEDVAEVSVIRVEHKGTEVTYCWPNVRIESGMYQVEFRFERPSGEIVQYSWVFVLAEN